MFSHITIKGARVHNLKNIQVQIPLQKITCLVGPSGSGKTSLAFHTLLAESKRRFLVALPNSMKLFTEKPAPVDVDELSPVLPVFGLNQHNPILSSRVNVADGLGLTDEFQKLYSVLSYEICPVHQLPLMSVKIQDQIKMKNHFEEEDVLHFIVTKEIYKIKLGEQFLPSRGWDDQAKSIVDFHPDLDFWELGRLKVKSLDEVDKFFIKQNKCLFNNFIIIRKNNNQYQEIPMQLNNSLQCPKCDEKDSIKKTDFLFSPHNGLGACSSCQGFGANLKYDEKKYFDEDRSVADNAVTLFKMSKFAGFQRELLKAFAHKDFSTNTPLKKLPSKAIDLIHQGYGKYPGLEGAFAYLESKKYKPAIKMIMRYYQSEFTCPQCQGSRLNPLTKRFVINLANQLYSLPSLLMMSVDELHKVFHQVKSDSIPAHARSIVLKISRTLQSACDIGLGHLSLQRKLKSLSGGEYQRSLLVKFFSYDGTDSLFILDEPSMGISEEQWPKMWKGIESLKEQGNTVLLIEHQNYFAEKSDEVIALGPGSGKDGGEIIPQDKLQKNVPRVKDKKKTELKDKKQFKLALQLVKPSIYGKSYSDVMIYENALHVVKGFSGVGKTSVILKVLANSLHRLVHDEYLYDRDGSFEKLDLHKDFDSVLVADNNLKRYNSRSSVGSFTDLSLVVRKYYAQCEEAKKLKLTESHFSTNSAQGQCSQCMGSGVQRIELQYMEDVVLTCDECNGFGLKKEYAMISDGRMTVAEALNAPMNTLFDKIPLTAKFKKVLQAIIDLKLSHLSLARTMSSLSGGEKQRLNLVSQFLSVPQNAILFFENLSFGLSMNELPSLVDYVKSLTEHGNTVVIIDQNKTWNSVADYEIVFSENQKVQTHYCGSK
jgi:excinuclease ABC subunit A